MSLHDNYIGFEESDLENDHDVTPEQTAKVKKEKVRKAFQHKPIESFVTEYEGMSSYLNKTGGREINFDYNLW